MSIALAGKTILITGASSGIGRSTAIACTKAGMHCVITARREDKLQSLAKELGDTCTVIVGDVTDTGFNQKLLDESGDLHAIFANAGYGLDKEIAGCDMNQFIQLFALNVYAATELASLAAKNMKVRGSGHILFCASCLSKFATPQHGAYCASKSAIEAVAKSMRMELRSMGVHVSTVHPIGTRTEFFEESSKRSGTGTSVFASQTPSWLMQSPDTVAKAIVKCLRKPKPEVWTSLPVRSLCTLFSAFPRIAQFVVNR